MGLNLPIVTQTFGASEDLSWLGSEHGTSTADSITLRAADFVASFPTGIVPSGVVLGRVTASGLVVPYLAANSDGSQVAIGHLFTTVDLTNGNLIPIAANWANVSAALLWHGEVIVSKLPANHGLDNAAKAALAQIHYV